MAGSVDLQIWTQGKPLDYDPWTTGEGAGHIHCMTFELLGNCSVDKQGKPQGTRDYGEGIRITKRLDGTSPQLLNLFRSSAALKAEFTFHLPDVGRSEHALQAALTVTIGEGKKAENVAWIRGFKLVSPDSDVAAANAPQEPYEEVVFSFTHIKFHRTGTNNDHSPISVVVEDDLTQIGA